MIKRKWWVFVALILLAVGIFFVIPYINNTDFSHSEITQINYQNVTNNLEIMGSNISLNEPAYTENAFDFSQVPENFILNGKSYIVYPFSDEFHYSVTPINKEIPNKIQEDFVIAKKLTIDFAKKCNFSNDLISRIENITLKCGEFNYISKISNDLFMYYNNSIYVQSTIFGHSSLSMYFDEEFVQMMVTELLKVLQEQTLNRRICSYFNDYLASTIASAIVGIDFSNNQFQPIKAFIKAVGSSKALEAFFYGFDNLINDGKIKSEELQLYLSIVQVMNSSLGGQSEDWHTYKSITGLSDGTIISIYNSIASIWYLRN